DGTNVTAYQNSTEAAAGSATCTSSQTRTCTNGTLSGTYTNQYCNVTCSLTANQGGGVLCVDASSPACPAPDESTSTEYTSSSAASCPSRTMTCGASGLSCSTGLMSDCTYNSCTVSSSTPFNIWVLDAGNTRVEEFNNSGSYITQFGTAGSTSGKFNSPMRL